MSQQVISFSPGYKSNQDQINDWLNDNPNVKVLGIWACQMYDLYQGTAPTICNQWEQVYVLYEINKPKLTWKNSPDSPW